MFMAFALSAVSYAGNKADKTVKIRMIETTDVHGRFFPYDFINQQPSNGSLARVSSYVDSLRTIYGDRLLLMDAGDVLQGQPVVTYYNYEDAVSSARKWMEVVKKKERPDVIVGLFHTGINDRSLTNGSLNDATHDIARQVPGFDVIFYGHDHSTHYEEVKSADGSVTVIVNPANNAMYVADAELEVSKKGRNKKLKVNIVDMGKRPVNQKYMDAFESQIDEVKKYVGTEVGSFTTSMTSRDCYFGPSTLVDFVHDVMLSTSGADISFASPLSFDVTVKSGPATLADMYKLYSYENDLCVMTLTGKEIRQYLEKSYDGWVTTMTSPDDHLICMNNRDASRDKFFGLKKPFYNLDTAAGIIYDVDVTKPNGERIVIKSMADGTPFDETRTYRVAVNSYRAAGGGGLLTKGAGIDKAQLESRITWRGDYTLRDYIIKYVRKHSPITPKTHNNWQFVPTEWTAPAAKRDYQTLWGERAK